MWTWMNKVKILIHILCYECGSIKETYFQKTYQGSSYMFRFSQYSLYYDGLYLERWRFSLALLLFKGLEEKHICYFDIDLCILHFDNYIQEW